MASHLLYTQPGILKDKVPTERALGISAGLAWGKAAEATVVYVDRGQSPGMLMGIKAAKDAGRRVEYRSLYKDTNPSDNWDSSWGDPTRFP